MSSILKALRKIEEEKRAASHKAPDLRMDQGNTPAASRPLRPLIVGVLLGAICVGCFFLWPFAEVPEVTTQSQAKPRQGLDVGLAVQPAASGMSTPSIAVQTPALQAQPEIAPVELPKVSEQTVPATPDVAGSTGKEVEKNPVSALSTDVPSKVPELVVESPKIALPAAKVVSPPALKALPEGFTLEVTEVFYVDDPANSMAVVNDLPVMIGTYLDSAVVAEIHSERVVFKIADETYEVPVTPAH